MHHCFARPQRQLLANLIQYGYNWSRPWDQVKRFSAPFIPRPPPPSGTGFYERKRQRLLNQIRRWQEHLFVGGSIRISCVTRPHPHAWAFGHHGAVPLLQRSLPQPTPKGNRTVQHYNSCSMHLSAASPPTHLPLVYQGVQHCLCEAGIG